MAEKVSGNDVGQKNNQKSYTWSLERPLKPLSPAQPAGHGVNDVILTSQHNLKE